jgi:hypothetical protein
VVTVLLRAALDGSAAEVRGLPGRARPLLLMEPLLCLLLTRMLLRMLRMLRMLRVLLMLLLLLLGWQRRRRRRRRSLE